MVFVYTLNNCIIISSMSSQEIKVPSNECKLQTRSIETQTEIELVYDNSPPVPPSNSLGIVELNRMEDFIILTCRHAAKCGVEPKLIKRDTSQGAGITELWKCPVCGAIMRFDNCARVRTRVIEEGRQYSRASPSINIKLAAGARSTGINLKKLTRFLHGKIGVKIMAYRNLLHCEKRWRAASKTIFAERRIENQKEHVAASRALIGYGGDIEWEYQGQMCSSCCGDVAIDGAGITRSFRNNYRGSTSGAITVSPLTGRPIDLVVDKVINNILFHILSYVFILLNHVRVNSVISTFRQNASDVLAH
jgi:hypothetical protein